MDKPSTVNIMGIVYTVDYMNNPADVDIRRQMSLWGQLDPWTRTIRVYDNGKAPNAEIFHTLLHEILHGIGLGLHLESFNKKENHDELDILALALMDVFCRNGWLVLDEKPEGE